MGLIASNRFYDSTIHITAQNRYPFFGSSLVYAVVPPKVEYSITERGKRAVEIITVIRDYGLELMEAFGVENPPPPAACS